MINYYVLLAVWIGLQFGFAALLSATEPDLPYALACYMPCTPSTVTYHAW